MAEGETSLAQVLGGKLISSRVADAIVGAIEKGPLAAVGSIVIHQTGGSTAQSALSSYRAGGAGAHFLIDKEGAILQTARIDQKCWHTGTIKSRCYDTKTCEATDLKKIEGILFKKGEEYKVRIHNLHKYESTKTYPARYPSNDDSIGIEIVGSFDAKGKTYETVTPKQNESLVWLVETLISHLKITQVDVFRHPQVSYKEPTEAATASWKK